MKKALFRGLFILSIKSVLHEIPEAPNGRPYNSAILHRCFVGDTALGAPKEFF